MQMLRAGSQLISTESIAVIDSNVINKTGRCRIFFAAYADLKKTQKIQLGKIDNLRNEEVATEVANKFLDKYIKYAALKNIINIDMIIAEIENEVIQ